MTLTPTTHEQKIEALKKLVHDAAGESVGVYRRAKNHNGPVFEPNGFITERMDALISVLSTTDAILVLNRILNEEN
jgi:hypothetical protein